MESFLRCDDCCYGGVKKPEYSVLSYTWGRWEVYGDPSYTATAASLPVKGLDWEVPVLESHFTVESFKRVVDQLGGLPEDGIEWAWIDIACIHQTHASIKMDEVGRQASISKTAFKAFVWLSHSFGHDLSHALQKLHMLSDALFEQRDTVDRTKTFSEQGEDQTMALLESAQGTMKMLLSDPWFTSLWTLQELMLRNDVHVLDHDASWVAYTDPEMTWNRSPCLTIEMIQGEVMDLMSGIQDLCLAAQDLASRQVDATARATWRIIARSGLVEDLLLGNTTNPNAQYGAAKYRRTSRAEDRVYAITQIYDIRVGRTLDPDSEELTVEALVEEFGLAIKARSALLGQLFVHTGWQAPKEGKSWLITQSSDVPNTLNMMPRRFEPKCKIARDYETGCVIAEGSVASLFWFQEYCTSTEWEAELANVECHLDGHVK